MKDKILLFKALDHDLLAIPVVHWNVLDVIRLLSIVESLHSLLIVGITGRIIRAEECLRSAGFE